MVTPSITPTENIRSWQEHEFWEDTERARKRKQRWWIAGTVLLFLILISVPVWWDRSPKWGALRLARSLGGQLNQAKRTAAVDGKAQRVRIEGGLKLVVESAPTCTSKEWGGAETVALGRPGDEDRWEVLTTATAERRGVPGVLERFCYDPISGYSADGPQTPTAGEAVSGWAIAPIADRDNGRLDRMAIVFVQGLGADIQFE